MPQGERSVADDIQFKHMLKHANLLYLGTRVLILLDLSYIGRFWTLFEAWLSMQAVSPEGLKPATPEQQRFDIVPIHGANNITGESLKAMWATRTPQEAYDLLKEPDVTVTNQSDKTVQLDKLLQLDDEVREAMRATGMEGIVEWAGTPLTSLFVSHAAPDWPAENPPFITYAESSTSCLLAASASSIAAGSMPAGSAAPNTLSTAAIDLPAIGSKRMSRAPAVANSLWRAISATVRSRGWLESMRPPAKEELEARKPVPRGWFRRGTGSWILHDDAAELHAEV